MSTSTSQKSPSDVRKAQSTQNVDNNQMAKQTSTHGSSAFTPNTQQQSGSCQQSHHKLSENGPLNNRQTAMIVKAYVIGYLKAIHPSMYANTVVLSRRIVVYLKDEDIAVEQGEIIEFMATCMAKQLAFTESKLLGRWRGSAYKLMYRELASFLIMYYTIAVLYRYVFDDTWKRRFESFATYCREFLSVVPITFVLGFYLSFVVGRWWQQYLAVPWPDKLAIEISAYVQGADERGRMIRRSLVRYLNLISCLTFQQTSTIIKKRFPTLEHMLEAGIMTADEKLALETTQTPHGLWWIPAHWFGQLAMLARKEGRIHDDLHLKSLIDDMIEFRNACGTVWSYDWISVVAIAVYSFFASCLFGRQFLYKSPILNDTTNNGVDYYVPIFTIFQFLFYVGWLKVAEAMICPFGSDDDDFELNWIIDRNIQVSYLIVDQLYRNTPKPTKDALWNDIEIELPYTQASANYRKDPFFGSTNAMSVSEKLAEWNLPEQMTPIDEEAAIGLRETLNSIDSKFRQRKVRTRKAKNQVDSPTDDTPKEPKDEDSDNVVSESQTADLSDEEEDEVEADQRSNGSTQYNVTLRLKGRLAGLPLGTSRQTLGSKKFT
ncbi:Bestrophin-like protein [Aphelenchoides besseyi]|nr:Bestrophin-like protein [Aphelenchoides besseyi]